MHRGMTAVPPPLALLAELTHRCPLRCPYCSNPVELARARNELDTASWRAVLSQAAEIGVLQVHFSGGEPTARHDLADLVAHAAAAKLYSNLITAGVLLDEARWARLAAAGLDHVQLSFQDSEPNSADRIAGYAGGYARKRAFAAMVRAAGLPLTINAVVHRQNLDRLEEMIALALELGARRIEIAHVQYYGWALRNRAALMPTRVQLDRTTEAVERARDGLKGTLVIDYLVPDYYAAQPKACLGGWGRQAIVVTPAGRILPCHAANTLPGIAFPSIATTTLDEAWYRSAAFNRFRGTDWMPEPCRSCDRREVDWGGCRCQAFALTGDASVTDPTCELAPDRARLDPALIAATEPPPPFIYRQMSGPSRAGVEPIR